MLLHAHIFGTFFGFTKSAERGATELPSVGGDCVMATTAGGVATHANLVAKRRNF
jgi:hypothetical protein